MSSTEPLTISIQPLQYGDIPSCSQNVAAAFAVDPLTNVKQLGRKPSDMCAITYNTLPNALERKNQVHVKAIDEKTGKLVGHKSWVFRGVDTDLAPGNGPSDDKPQDSGPVEAITEAAEDSQEDGSDMGEQGSFDRLHALEDADIQEWVTEQIPPGPCIFINSLNVSTLYQSMGVGRNLLQYGNTIADRLCSSIWVHSSHQAFKAYERAGFEARRMLDLDLEEYAPRAPRYDEEVMGERGSGKWGKYIIRYMARTPEKGD